MNASTRLARETVSALLDAGLTEAVLSPGSRNAPLSFALLDAARAGLLRLHTRIDERTAGFLALGLASTSRRPVAVVCTSGTAVANLQPAVLEAWHSQVPVVAVTGDRPLRLRGTSANQTTDQVGLLRGARVLDLGEEDLGQDRTDGTDRTEGSERGEGAGQADGAAAREVARVLAGGPGPVHLNLRFEEPLVPEERWHLPTPVGTGTPGASTAGPTRSDPDPVDPVTISSGAAAPRTVVVAGDSAGPRARVLAEAAGWPLLAEPTSGARTGTHALRCYRLLLDGPLGAEVERVVVLGHPTLSRPVTRLLGRADVEVWDVGGETWRPRPFPVHREVGAVRVDPPGADVDWLARWQTADAALSRRVDELLEQEPDLTPHQVAGAVSRAVPPGGLLVVGASSPVRDLDLMAVPSPVGERRKVVANRGLAGIDGTVSTAIGAALARPASARSLLLVGDVTFLHDSNGLVLGPDEPRPDLTVVVVNDDGGSIFSMLEQGADAYADCYEKLFGTPHGVDLAALCAATGTPYRSASSAAELESALAGPAGGVEVVEVRVRRDNRRDLDARIRALRP